MASVGPSPWHNSGEGQVLSLTLSLQQLLRKQRGFISQLSHFTLWLTSALISFIQVRPQDLVVRLNFLHSLLNSATWLFRASIVEKKFLEHLQPPPSPFYLLQFSLKFSGSLSLLLSSPAKVMRLLISLSKSLFKPSALLPNFSWVVLNCK